MAALEGKRWDGGTHRIEARDFRAYAAATDDANAACEGPDAVAPPMFHVRPLIGLLEAMANDPELGLDVLRLVHGEHAMAFLRPLRDGDELALAGVLTKLEDKPSGRVATFSITGTVGGEPALDGTTVFFVRAPVRDAGAKKPAAPAPEPPPPTFTAEARVAPDQAARYAEASGDRNPIHLDDAVAKRAGLPGVILHGLCTMAFAARAIVDGACGGDPRRLASIGVRWARPVLPGQTVITKVWDQGGGRLSFVCENEAGQPVVTNGKAEVRP
jgi:acyl dehydratase